MFTLRISDSKGEMHFSRWEDMNSIYYEIHLYVRRYIEFFPNFRDGAIKFESFEDSKKIELDKAKVDKAILSGLKISMDDWFNQFLVEDLRKNQDSFYYFFTENRWDFPNVGELDCFYPYRITKSSNGPISNDYLGKKGYWHCRVDKDQIMMLKMICPEYLIGIDTLEDFKKRMKI